jgi:hypothetical protein
MKIIRTKFLSLKQKEALFLLWNLEYPKVICYSAITQFENYLNGIFDKIHYLLIDIDNQILGWGVTFVREEQKWFAIILDSKIHKIGLGSLLLEELKKDNTCLNGWAIDHPREVKQNGEMYISPILFYTKNGFIVESTVRLENEIISAVKIKWIKE